MNTVPDLPRILRRIAETIAWCQLHVSLDSPIECLRTPGLRPVNLHSEPSKWGTFDYDWGALEEKQAVVNALAEQLGLHLNSEKGQITTIVIDRIEKPGEN